MDFINDITLLQWFGLLLFLVARMIKRSIKRRRFERTNAYGVQGFTSFNAYEYTSFFEAIVYFFGTVLQLAGMIFLLLEWVANSL